MRAYKLVSNRRVRSGEVGRVSYSASHRSSVEYKVDEWVRGPAGPLMCFRTLFDVLQAVNRGGDTAHVPLWYTIGYSVFVADVEVSPQPIPSGLLGHTMNFQMVREFWEGVRLHPEEEISGDLIPVPPGTIMCSRVKLVGEVPWDVVVEVGSSRCGKDWTRTAPTRRRTAYE